MENIERILAGLIILALLTLLILIAFPVSRPEPGRVPGTGTSQEANRAPATTQSTEKPPPPPPASETRTEQRPAEPPKKYQPQEEAQKRTRVGNGSEQPTEQRSSEETGRDMERGRRLSDGRDCNGSACDCSCCSRERRYRTVEREREYRTAERRHYRRKPAPRYLPEPDDDDGRYWAERRWRPYWADNSRYYWAQIPPGACPE